MFKHSSSIKIYGAQFVDECESLPKGGILNIFRKCLDVVCLT